MSGCPDVAFGLSCSRLTGWTEVYAETMPIPSGATDMDVHVDTITVSGFSGSCGAAVQCFDAGGATLFSGVIGLTFATRATTAGAHTGLFAIPAGGVELKFSILVTPFSGTGAFTFDVTGHVSWDGACDPTAVCAYGTQSQVWVTPTVIITGTVIELVTAFYGAPWLGFLFNGIIGVALSPRNLCAGLPPAVPSAFGGVSSGGYPVSPTLTDIVQFFEALAWPVICECKPATGGGPDPTPPDLIVTVAPVTDSGPPIGGGGGTPGGGGTGGTGSPPLPVPVPVVCDGLDLCASINNLQAMLVAIAGNLAQTRADVQLIQRQAVPFAYIRGTAHAELIDVGELEVADLVGVAVSFPTKPGYLGLRVGLPDANLYLGWLTLGTADGWTRSMHLIADPTLLCPIGGEITRIGYSLQPGVVATVTELIREP